MTTRSRPLTFIQFVLVFLCVLCGEGIAMNSAPHAIVEINGFQWDSFKHESLFQKVSVELATGEASMATWTCVDERFGVIDRYAGIAEGTNGWPVIRVWLGYGRDVGEPVFKGLVARIERSRTTTTFRAYD